MPSSFTKDPDATLDYQVDWSELLDSVSDYIVSAATSADSGITVHTQTFTSAAHTIWLRGGTVGQRYRVRSKIWTQGNRVDERTITILVRER
jgi:frataxin-like iron-binding protein CyaY